MKQIYALLGEKPPKIVYVGVAKSAEIRRNGHWRTRNSTYRSPVKDWLCNLAEPPEFYVLEDVKDEVAFAAEQYYTEIMRQINPDLLNVLDGCKKREITRQKISTSLQGHEISETTRQKIGESVKNSNSLQAKIRKFTCRDCEAGPFTFNELGNHKRYRCES